MEPKRLERIRVMLRELLDNDRSLDLKGPIGPYGNAAKRLNATGAETVVMGHTHQARRVGPPELATYINTGTWADIIKVPPSTLEDGRDKELESFLGALHADRNVRCRIPHFAEVVVSATGEVKRAAIEKARMP